ncbi:MAG: hypothetical protein O2971_01030 [Proteobacteria bacterium]|nr:hypothetical protein [Pseudomonadota bacterium]
MKCNNHPNVAAIANCGKCDSPMCGLCANFSGSEVLCEKCVAIRETERYVAAQSKQLGPKNKPLKVDQPDDKKTTSPGRRKSTSKAWQWAIIVASLIFVTVRMFFFSAPTSQSLGEPDIARQIALTSFAQCLLVFREIGVSLANGLNAQNTPRCADSDRANIVTTIGSDIRVAHPDPGFYGYRQIYVSRNNPDPILIE